MTIEEKLKMYREKKQFVFEMTRPFVKISTGHSVDSIIYEVFFREDEICTDIVEWITVRYKGGAEMHRVVTCNSNAANFRAVADMLEGGCYEQNFMYESLADRGYKKLDLYAMYSYKEIK